MNELYDELAFWIVWAPLGIMLGLVWVAFLLAASPFLGIVWLARRWSAHSGRNG